MNPLSHSIPLIYFCKYVCRCVIISRGHSERASGHRVLGFGSCREQRTLVDHREFVEGEGRRQCGNLRFHCFSSEFTCRHDRRYELLLLLFLYSRALALFRTAYRSYCDVCSAALIRSPTATRSSLQRWTLPPRNCASTRTSGAASFARSSPLRTLSTLSRSSFGCSSVGA